MEYGENSPKDSSLMLNIFLWVIVIVLVVAAALASLGVFGKGAAKQMNGTKIETSCPEGMTKIVLYRDGAYCSKDLIPAYERER